MFPFHFFLRVIKPEEGKKLADSWGAAFMESSAKENEVMIDISLCPCSSVLSTWLFPDTHSHTADYILAIQTAVEVFKRIILEMEKADGNAPSEEKKCAVM